MATTSLDSERAQLIYAALRLSALLSMAEIDDDELLVASVTDLVLAADAYTAAADEAFRSTLDVEAVRREMQR